MFVPAITYGSPILSLALAPVAVMGALDMLVGTDESRRAIGSPGKVFWFLSPGTATEGLA